MSKINRPMASGYSEAGASKTRRALKSYTARSTSANEDINWNNETLRRRGRMLYMSAPVATSAIKTNRTKVVGTGLTLKSAIEHEALGMTPDAAKKWQKNTESEFEIWASKRENCDAIGMNNFAGLQQLTVISWLASGDVFAVFKRYTPTFLNPYSLRIHMIEADRISTPSSSGMIIAGRNTDGVNTGTQNRIYDGVEVDCRGMVQAYHVCNAYPNQLIKEKIKWQRVKAYGKKTGLPNILQMLDTERCEQYRGVTYLAPVIESLLNISRYTQSELMAALVQSFFTAWIKTKTDPSDIPINEVGGNDLDADSPFAGNNASTNQNEYEMGPGTVLHLEEDEDVVFSNPNIPTQGFDSFFKVICKEIGAALEMPYEILLKEFNKSYSASRAALMEAWEAFAMRRKWLVDMFCQPVYEVWLSEAVSIGRIKAPGFFSDPRTRAAWCKARWIGPIQGQLDPLKEVKADVMAVEHGFKSHDQVTRESGGGDWEDNVEQLKRENAALRAAQGKRDIPLELDAEEEDEEENGDAQN